MPPHLPLFEESTIVAMMLHGKASAYRIAQLLALTLGIIVLAAIITWPPQPAKPGKVAVTFIAFTNALDSGRLRTFAVFSVSNLSDFNIRPFSTSFQKQGQSESLFYPCNFARNLHGCAFPQVIKSGDSAIIAVDEPFDFSGSTRKQFNFVFLSDKLKDRLRAAWLKIQSTNTVALRIGRALDDTTLVIGDSAWVDTQPEKRAPNQKTPDLNSMQN